MARKAFKDPQAAARVRGHTVPISIMSGAEGWPCWVSPQAELDDLFDVTCGLDGERLVVRGWMVTIEDGH